MKNITKFSQLPTIALASVLLFSGAQGAFAASSVVRAPVASVGQITQADYLYHKKHYAYKYEGKYYNHRAQSNGAWHYSN